MSRHAWTSQVLSLDPSACPGQDMIFGCIYIQAFCRRPMKPGSWRELGCSWSLPDRVQYRDIHFHGARESLDKQVQGFASTLSPQTSDQSSGRLVNLCRPLSPFTDLRRPSREMRELYGIYLFGVWSAAIISTQQKSGQGSARALLASKGKIKIRKGATRLETWPSPTKSKRSKA